MALLSTGHSRMAYTGLADPSQQDLKHYIGIFDPDTGKVNIVEARRLVVRGLPKTRVPELVAEEKKKVRYGTDTFEDEGERMLT